MRENDLLLPAVLLDGSLGRDFASGVTFHRHAFDPAIAASVLATLASLGIEPCVNLDAEPRDVMVGSNPSTHPGHLAFIEPWRLTDDLAQAVQERPVLSFVVCGRERELLQPAVGAVAGIATGSVTPDLAYGGYSMSIRPFGVSKWNGVLAYCEAYGVDPTRVLAVGDGENDVELLRSAAIACAVDDGCDAVLRLAHHRLGPAHEGGWRGVLDLLNA
jgi:hypothetical protein